MSGQGTPSAGVRRRYIHVFGLFAALFAFCALALAQQQIPKLEARVTDLTGTLTAEQQSALTEKLAAFESRKGSQIAVLIIPTTEPEDIEQFSIRVTDQWKLGREGVDDGVLLLVAKDDRRLRIEVGQGLEGALTDATTNRITDDVISPLFRQGDFFGGINAGVERIIRVIDGEPLPEPDRGWKDRSGGVLSLLPFLFVAVIVGSLFLRAIFGRTIGSAVTAGGTGILVWLATGLFAAAMLAGVGAFVFSLFGGVSRGARWSSNPRHGGWGGGWGGGLGGGGFGGGGFGGGGGGGFSGGGGGFSGGGASGSW